MSCIVALESLSIYGVVLYSRIAVIIAYTSLYLHIYTYIIQYIHMIFTHVLVYEIVSTAMWLAESSLLIRLSSKDSTSNRWDKRWIGPGMGTGEVQDQPIIGSPLEQISKIWDEEICNTISNRLWLLKDIQISSKIIKNHQISSNIIEYHRISSN